MLNKVRDSINVIWQMLPSDKKNQLVIGEVGAADRLEQYCEYTNTQAATLEVSERDHLYRAIAQDTQINAQTNMIMFWRLMNLPVNQIPGTDRCEAFYGVVHADNSGYKNIGINLFQYLLQP